MNTSDLPKPGDVDYGCFHVTQQDREAAELLMRQDGPMTDDDLADALAAYRTKLTSQIEAKAIVRYATACLFALTMFCIVCEFVWLLHRFLK